VWQNGKKPHVFLIFTFNFTTVINTQEHVMRLHLLPLLLPLLSLLCLSSTTPPFTPSSSPLDLSQFSKTSDLPYGTF
jgi:hypothetical protein